MLTGREVEVEGLTGIEPASLVWKTKALPLSYSPKSDGLPPGIECAAILIQVSQVTRTAEPKQLG
jgi:hypothetical protein